MAMKSRSFMPCRSTSADWFIIFATAANFALLVSSLVGSTIVQSPGTDNTKPARLSGTSCQPAGGLAAADAFGDPNGAVEGDEPHAASARQLRTTSSDRFIARV